MVLQDAQSPTVETDPAVIRSSILGEDAPKPEEGPSKEPQTAPANENPEEPKTPASPDRELAEGQSKVEPDKPKVEAEPEKVKTPTPPVDDSDKSKIEEVESDLLGVEIEDETNPKWKKRYEDSCSHITRLERDLNEKTAYLDSMGLEIIKTKDGFALAPTENFKQKPVKEIIDPSKIYDSLTDEDKEMFDENPKAICEKIASKVAQELLVKHPPVNATKSDRILSEGEIDEVYGEFAESKLADNKTARYPDATEPLVKLKMSKVFFSNTKGMDKFREISQKDKELNHIMLEYCWLKTFRALHGANALRAATEKEKATKKQENLKEPAIDAKGASLPAQGQRAQRSGNDLSSDLRKQIINSDEETRSKW